MQKHDSALLGTNITTCPVNNGMEMTQSMSSFQQSSNVQQQSQQSFTNDIYEVTDMAGGVMKGYKRKDEVDFAGSNLQEDPNRQTPHGKFMKDTGIFGGITGDHNCLVEEDVEFDYKKHSVRDLVGHFSKVKPRAEIPVQYLPEQRMFNGEQGPSLNYLSTKSESNSSTQSMMKTTMSKQDVNASKQEYEARKKMQSSQQQQQQQQQDQQQHSFSTSQQQSSVVMRSSEQQSEEQKQMLSQRRASLKDALLMDPATQHANAGIIDPSAILRGDHVSQWNQSNSSSQHTTLMSASPSTNMYISKTTGGPKPLGHTLPRTSSKK